MKTNIGGCKVVIKEKTSKEAILNTIAVFLTRLEENQGIEEFSNINLYFQIYKNGAKQILINNENIENTYNSFLIEQSQQESTKILFDTTVDFDKIKQNVENVKLQKNLNPEICSIAVSDYEKMLQQHFNKKIEKQNTIIKERDAIIAITRKQEEEKKQKLSLFKEMICKNLHIDWKELSNITTSINYITDKKTILKYIKTSQIPPENNVIRITFKDKDTKIITHTEIYNLNFELIH